jgi:hypothetical protein
VAYRTLNRAIRLTLLDRLALVITMTPAS